MKKNLIIIPLKFSSWILQKKFFHSSFRNFSGTFIRVLIKACSGIFVFRNSLMITERLLNPITWNKVDISFCSIIPVTSSIKVEFCLTATPEFNTILHRIINKNRINAAPCQNPTYSLLLPRIFYCNFPSQNGKLQPTLLQSKHQTTAGPQTTATLLSLIQSLRYLSSTQLPTKTRFQWRKTSH